jgi:hypothetical protein
VAGGIYGASLLLGMIANLKLLQWPVASFDAEAIDRPWY